jgi:hypothetical protein
MIEIWDGQSDLRPLAEAWAKEIGIDADMDCAVEDLNSMLNDPDSDVIVLIDGGEVVGGMGITVQNISHTRELYSAERYWYILPGHRHLARGHINYAKQWSRDKGCVKMMICEWKYVSCARLYELLGFKVHETIYIGDL